MKKFIKCILLILSAITLLISSVNTTLCFVTSKTDTITNIFKPEEKLKNGISVIKRVEHPLGKDYAIPENIAFDFTLSFGKFYAETTLKTVQGNMKTDANGDLTVKVQPDVPFTVEGIDVGTSVTVSENDFTLEGFAKKDENKKTVLVPEVSFAEAEFVNTYTPKAADCKNITLKGKKVLEGRDWKENDSFSFLLEYKFNGQWVKLDKQTITYSEENFKPEFDFTKAISKLSFNTVGEYEFRMSEEKGELKGMVYDDTINAFSLFVTDKDMDGKLEISDVKNGEHTTSTRYDSGFAINVVFNNTFKPPVPKDKSVYISVTKRVSNKGSYKRSPEGFEFVLVNTETAEEYTVKTDANGDGKIEINLTNEDIEKTLTYKLYEKKGEEKGVTYDTRVYTVEIKPYLSEDYEIAAEYFVDAGKVEEVNAEFTNVCDMDKPVVPDTGMDKSVYFWMILAVLSGTSCIVILLTDRRERKA